MDHSSKGEKKISESDKEEIPKYQQDLTIDMIDIENQLQAFPEAIKLLHKMREYIKKQNKKIIKLRNRLVEQKKLRSVSSKILVNSETQTDETDQDLCFSNKWDLNEQDPSTSSITEQVKQVAESALQQTGFVYEETSGLYYDYNSGYYYDGTKGLYYDGNSGTYYYYDETSKSYQFHSQVNVIVNEVKTNSSKVRKKKKFTSKEKNKDRVKKPRVERKQIHSTKDDDNFEEGECTGTDSDESFVESSSQLSTSSERDSGDEQDLAKTYPPCMRIIVKETTLLPKLKIGTLFVVAYTGGSMGREGDHSVLIHDINISKHHARFLYNENKKCYEIIDLGSRNGTYLNGKRISVAKQESEPIQVPHGSIVQVGGTKLLCHIHNGNETCGHCEPGLVQQTLNTEENKVSKKNLHKLELKRLKNKFGVEKDNTTVASQVATGYQDRAHARRRCVGSQNDRAKTQQSSIDESIAKDNKGFKLLSKMGWSEGQSLGKDGDGRVEPIPMTNNYQKSGLGAKRDAACDIEIDANTEKKQTLWRKTRQRYDEINN